MKTPLKSRPLNRTAEQVRAILRGATQFRVPVKPQPVSKLVDCPFGTIGDELWIKTGYTTRYDKDRDETVWSVDGVGFTSTHGRACSKSSRPKKDGKHPGMFMPEWLSGELLPALEIVGVRVERVQEISEEDAKACGYFLRRCACAEMQRKPRNGLEAAFRQTWCHIHGQEFRDMWSSQYGPESWDRNDWVWVVNYQRREA